MSKIKGQGHSRPKYVGRRSLSSGLLTVLSAPKCSRNYGMHTKIRI